MEATLCFFPEATTEDRECVDASAAPIGGRGVRSPDGAAHSFTI